MKNLNVIQIENGLSFKLYDTVILIKRAESVILSYGDFKTKTTFKAINQILVNLKIPLLVYQSKGRVIIENLNDSIKLEFKNGIEFNLKGHILKAVTV